MSTACFATLWMFRPGLPLELVAQQFVKGIDNLPLTAIALFLLLYAQPLTRV